MKKLQYFEFRVQPSELALTSVKTVNQRNMRIYSSLNQGKLWSHMQNKYDSDEYIGNKLFFPTHNESFSADQKIPTENIEFYEFNIENIAEGPDDFMKTIEINPVFGFFVSQKCKDLLKDFRLPSHKYYPVKVEFEESYDYFFLLIAKNNLKINYALSSFVERFDQENEVSIERYEELLELRPANENAPEHYTVGDFKEKTIVFDEAPDIYPVVTSANAWFYFSKRLKETLEKEKLTGFRFYESDKINFFSMV